VKNKIKMFKKFKRGEGNFGFTLIELLVVIAIIGILSTQPGGNQGTPAVCRTSNRRSWRLRCILTPMATNIRQPSL